MSKYDISVKIKVIKEYEKNNISQSELSKKYKIPQTTISNWIKWYSDNGIKGISKKFKNKSYTSNFKLFVLQYRKTNNLTFRETAVKFDITNDSIIVNWQKKYTESGLDGLNSKTKGRKPKMKKTIPKEQKRKENLKESEKEELLRLREENLLLKAAIAYEKKLQALLMEKDLKTRKKRKR